MTEGLVPGTREIRGSVLDRLPYYLVYRAEQVSVAKPKSEHRLWPARTHLKFHFADLPPTQLTVRRYQNFTTYIVVYALQSVRGFEI